MIKRCLLSTPDNNQLPVMCPTRGERRLISVECQKECVKSQFNGQTDSQRL